MTRQLQFADWVPFPVTRVFAFFSSPENLPRLMPPETQTRIDRLQLVAPPLPPAEDAPSNRGADWNGFDDHNIFSPLQIFAHAPAVDCCNHRIRRQARLRRRAAQGTIQTVPSPTRVS